MDNGTDVEITMEGTIAIAAFKSTSISDVDRITVASAEIRKFINENQPKRLIFDFEGVKFFSSQVLDYFWMPEQNYRYITVKL